LLTVTDGSLGTPPKGFVHDLSRSEIGRGLHVFVAAREAFQRWEQFDLGWVQVVNPIAKIAPGELVAVETHTAYLWSISFNRVVEVVDSPTRFVIDFDPESESVSYLIEAVSRPRHILARVGYPFSRAMQHRFTRDSHARMRRSVIDQLIRGAKCKPEEMPQHDATRCDS
jgi:uncharacterized protein (UPF0548 family)